MICDEVRSLLSAYHDDELDAVARDRVDAHLRECESCAVELRRHLRLSQSIREQMPTYSAPKSLRRSFEPRKSPSGVFGLGLASGLAVAAAFAAFFLLGRHRDLSAELVSDHVRSLMANHLIDVASSDRHTVKPWFLGRINFAPTVPNLADQGFPLIGGRLDYADGKPVSALVYGKQKHVINVFVMPDEAGPASADLNGYHVLHWSSGGLGYWAVSDVAAADLAEFARDFQANGP